MSQFGPGHIVDTQAYVLNRWTTMGRVVTVLGVLEAYGGPVRLVLTTASYASSSGLLRMLHGGFACDQDDWSPVLYTRASTASVAVVYSAMKQNSPSGSSGSAIPQTQT